MLGTETPLEDGRTAIIGADGSLVSIVNTDGTSYQPDRSMTDDFLRQTLGGLGGAVSRAFAASSPRAVASAAPAAPASSGAITTKKALMLGAIVAAVLFGPKLLKRFA